MKEIILVVIVIALLSGAIHTIAYSSYIHYIETVVVASTYALAVFGLMSMYQSVRVKKPSKRWLMLFMGALSVFIAYFTLEALYKSYGGE